MSIILKKSDWIGTKTQYIALSSFEANRRYYVTDLENFVITNAAMELACSTYSILYKQGDLFICSDSTGDYIQGALYSFDKANLSWSLIYNPRPFSETTPLVDGTAAAGTAVTVSRGDHRHPIDTSRAADSAVVHKALPETITGVKTFSVNTIFNNTTSFNGQMTINGNIIQNGQAYETHAEKLYTTNDYLITRDNSPVGLGIGLTGIIANNYDGSGTKGGLLFDADGVAYVGDISDVYYPTDGSVYATRAEYNGLYLRTGDSPDYVYTEITSITTDIVEGETVAYIKAVSKSQMQPLATREAEPQNGGFAKWNSSTLRFETDLDVAKDTLVVHKADNEVITGAKTFSSYLTLNGANDSNSPSNTSQLVMSNSDGVQHWALSSNLHSFIINSSTRSTNGQLVFTFGESIYARDSPDLGSATYPWKDLYISGALIGFTRDNIRMGSTYIGSSTTNTNNISIGFGSALNITGDSNISIGSGSSSLLTSGSNNVILGKSASSTSSGSSTVAIGALSKTSGNCAVSIGSSSSALNSYAIAIGNASSVSYQYAIAIGNDANASAYKAIQIGTGTNSVASTVQFGGSVQNINLVKAYTLIPTTEHPDTLVEGYHPLAFDEQVLHTVSNPGEVVRTSKVFDTDLYIGNMKLSYDENNMALKVEYVDGVVSYGSMNSASVTLTGLTIVSSTRPVSGSTGVITTVVGNELLLVSSVNRLLRDSPQVSSVGGTLTSLTQSDFELALGQGGSGSSNGTGYTSTVISGSTVDHYKFVITDLVSSVSYSTISGGSGGITVLV